MAFYSFISTRDFNGTPEQVAVLYYHRNGSDRFALEDTIESLLNRRLSPTRLLVVCGAGQEVRIRDEFSNLGETASSRLKVTSHIKIQPYDHLGVAHSSRGISIREVGECWEVGDSQLAEIANEGMKNLIDETGVILRAPRGYVFRKPSSHSSRTFIRAGNILKNPASLGLLTHLLMRSIPDGIEVLYIDSFTILSAALAFQKERGVLAMACNLECNEPEIINFHSYSLDPRLRFPADYQYAVLISASSSGSLARKLVSDHGAKSQCIFHLLSISSEGFTNERCIYTDKEKDDRVRFEIGFKKVINIPGEEFMASHGTPHPVKITRQHFSPLESRVFKEPSYQDSFVLNLASPDHSAYSVISLSGETGQECHEFDLWLQEELEHSVPSNIGWILSVDDHRSKVLAEKVQVLLKNNLNRDIPILNLSEILNPPVGFTLPEEPERSVLVVTSDTGSGENLLSASRALRSIRHKHRHYLVAHLFPETADQLKRLQSNLRVSGRKWQFGWSCFTATPLGLVESHDSWYIERALLARNLEGIVRGEFDPELLGYLERRLEVLNSRSVGGSKLFLPSPDLNPLALRPESVLFKGEYATISQPTIYMMVSGALQRARDHFDSDGKVLEEDCCFHGNPFISSVIDPDMFSRYNDGVIQAALLRTCAPDELNYSSHRVLSRHMRDLLRSAIAHYQSQSGEAVMEMLFALAIKRLRVSNSDYRNIVELISHNQRLYQFWNFLKMEPMI
jgi:hypothetical protein